MHIGYIYRRKKIKKAKGIKTCVVKKNLCFDDYYNCLFNNKNTTHSFQTFQSINHVIYTKTVNKVGLSSFDSKRYYLNAVESIPFFNSFK